MENEKVFEISIKDIFATIKNGLWLIITMAIVFALLAFGVSKFFIPKTYTATVKLYVEASKTGSIATDIYSHDYATELVNTYIEMLESHTFYEKVAENLDNKYTTTQISKMITFEAVEDTEVFKATVVAKTPTEAKIVADSISDVAPSIISSLQDDAKLKTVDKAVIPKEATSPNTMNNTLIAFVGGIILAIIILFVREALNVKIKFNPDATEINGLPILSAIPDFHQDTTNLSELLKTTADNSDTNA